MNIKTVSTKAIYFLFALIGLNPLMGLMALEQTHAVRAGIGDHLHGTVRWMYYGFWLLLSAVCFLLLIRRSRESLRALLTASLWALLLFWCLASAGWTQDLPSTLSRLPFLVGVYCFGILASMSVTLEEQHSMFFGSLAFYAIGSALLVWLVPGIGTMQGFHEGAFQGLSGHKNFLGRYMGIFLIMSALSLGCGSLRARVWSLAMVVLSAVLLIGSRSATGLMATAATAGAIILIWIYVRYQKWFFAALAMTAGLLITAVHQYEKVLALLGRQSSLTGRVPLWQALLDEVWKNPEAGYGYGAFWVAGTHPYESAIASIRYKQATHAHNGYLDALLDAGVVGLSFFLAAILMGLYYSVRRVVSSKKSGDLWIPAFLIFYLAANITDSFVFTRPKDGFFIVMLSLCMTLVQARRKTDHQ